MSRPQHRPFFLTGIQLALTSFFGGNKNVLIQEYAKRTVQQNNMGSDTESWHVDGHFLNSVFDPSVDWVPA